ncbi:unnamed protein product [Moneuplotes crassus]|uniref:Uncharacterized protein n=1 Tax=Euplotes crassus TaxID=5936 RepID=A0AAD1UHQ8_EUPCR|nr:unnamed protein product [Moneuplotes crassus]
MANPLFGEEQLDPMFNSTYFYKQEEGYECKCPNRAGSDKKPSKRRISQKDSHLLISTATKTQNNDMNDPTMKENKSTQNLAKTKPIFRKMAEKCPKSNIKPRKMLRNQPGQEVMKIPSKIEEQSKEEEKSLSNKEMKHHEKEPLSLRKDVVYKTLIRSLKRRVTEKCDLSLQKGWSKCDKEKAYFSEVDKLFLESYSTFFPTEQNRNIIELITDREFMRVDKFNVFNKENTKIYLCLLIIPEVIKPYLKNQKRRCQHKLIYDCLYKYSHKKLDKLLQSEFFSFLFKQYVDSGDFERMLQQDKTLEKHRDAYKQACEYFLSKIN